MNTQQMKNKGPHPKHCSQDQTLHPCGAIHFCPEDPEKCLFFKDGLR
jgi:hypothetical protein